MATAIAPTTMLRNEVSSMAPQTSNQLKPEIAEIVRKIHALRRVTKTTGFVTNRTIGEMLMRLSPDDLVAVGEALQLKPGEVKHLR
jgi:hypothetical protein